MRKATYQSLTEGETAFVNSFGFETTSELPDLPRSLLPGLFARLSTADIKLALRQKLVPVMCLPHVTLYGSVGEQARVAGEAMGFWIVANILAADYRATVKGSLGPALLRQATSGLKRSQPVFSASRRLTDEQGAFTLAITSGIAACLLVFPLQYFYLAASLFSGLFFLAIIALRLFSILGQSPRPLSVPITQSDEDLPVYSVLVPVFREIGVLDQLVDALSELQYPVAKLDIKLILEETDNKMLHAVAQKNLPPHFEVIVVPAGKLQTKPRALNYALQFARGSLLTIYDAEDIPEPLQLRKAAARFQVAPPYLACLQAELAFYNPDENWLTRQFVVEYATLFKTLLPALAHKKLPLLLGGTSNHFRTAILRRVGAWDPYNVTEDADLSLRLSRLGYETSILDSITYEEANPELKNWLQQRARWLKGFLQTWLVHMRQPAVLTRAIGLDGFWVMNAMTLGIVVSALFHPFLIIYAVFDLCSAASDAAELFLQAHFMSALNVVVLFCGYAFSIFSGYRALRLKRITGWWSTLLTMPLYWILMTVAGWMAIWQFIFHPFHWNKTRHGLSSVQRPAISSKVFIWRPFIWRALIWRPWPR